RFPPAYIRIASQAATSSWSPSRSYLSRRLFRKKVTAVLVWIRSVAADPSPIRFVLAGHRRQPFPQLPIGDGFSAAVAPIAALPTLKIHRHPLLQVLGIGNHRDPAFFSQGDAVR